MSRCNIKEKIERDPNGNVISETWEIFYEDGRLIKGSILSEKIAQEEVEAFDTIDELEEASMHIKVSHNKSIPDQVKIIIIKFI